MYSTSYGCSILCGLLRGNKPDANDSYCGPSSKLINIGILESESSQTLIKSLENFTSY